MTYGPRWRASRSSGVKRVQPHLPLVYSERADGYSANAVAVWFLTRFREIGIEGASSPSGRGTFITAQLKRLARPAAVYAIFRNWPGTRARRQRSATSRATPRRSVTC